MIKNNTLFILGAGAHMPYGFPSGQQLVSDLLYGFTDVNYSGQKFGINYSIEKKFIKESIFDPMTLRYFRENLRNSGRVSIDKFLRDQSNGWDELGKRLVSFIIALYESFCNPLEGSKLEGFSESFYHYLFDKMDTSNGESFLENNVRFITFNYDRSLEYFLSLSTQTNYSIDIAEYINSNIIHVHGKIGQLDRKIDLVRNKLPFGAIYDHNKSTFNIMD